MISYCLGTVSWALNLWKNKPVGHEVYVERESEMKLVQPTIMFALGVSLANRFEKDVPNSISCFFFKLRPVFVARNLQCY